MIIAQVLSMVITVVAFVVIMFLSDLNVTEPRGLCRAPAVVESHAPLEALDVWIREQLFQEAYHTFDAFS